MTSLIKNKIGLYKYLNLSFRGYDFAILEKYQSYVHKRMKYFDLNVTRTFSVPAQELLLESLVPKSTSVDQTIKMKIYERNLQIKNAQVTKLPPLIDFVIMTMPPGVTFSLKEHTKEYEDKIYFRDTNLESLKIQLEEYQNTKIIGS